MLMVVVMWWWWWVGGGGSCSCDGDDGAELTLSAGAPAAAATGDDAAATRRLGSDVLRATDEGDEKAAGGIGSFQENEHPGSRHQRENGPKDMQQQWEQALRSPVVTRVSDDASSGAAAGKMPPFIRNLCLTFCCRPGYAHPGQVAARSLQQLKSPVRTAAAGFVFCALLKCDRCSGCLPIHRLQH